MREGAGKALLLAAMALLFTIIGAVWSRPVPEEILQTAPLIFSEHPEEENLADILQESASGQMVQIFAGELSGSGIIYRSEGEKIIVATARHVLERVGDSVSVLFCDGLQLQSSVWTVMPDADLGFVEVDLSHISREHRENYYMVNTDRDSFDKLQAGAGVIVMGSKDSVAGNAYEGVLTENWIYLEDFSQYMMLVKAPALPGMSGGGVFDQRGRCIGILCGGNDEELAVLPLSILEARYEGAFANSSLVNRN